MCVLHGLHIFLHCNADAKAKAIMRHAIFQRCSGQMRYASSAKCRTKSKKNPISAQRTCETRGVLFLSHMYPIGTTTPTSKTTPPSKKDCKEGPSSTCIKTTLQSLSTNNLHMVAHKTIQTALELMMRFSAEMLRISRCLKQYLIVPYLTTAVRLGHFHKFERAMQRDSVPAVPVIRRLDKEVVNRIAAGEVWKIAG